MGGDFGPTAERERGFGHFQIFSTFQIFLGFGMCVGEYEIILLEPCQVLTFSLYFAILIDLLDLNLTSLCQLIDFH